MRTPIALSLSLIATLLLACAPESQPVPEAEGQTVAKQPTTEPSSQITTDTEMPTKQPEVSEKLMTEKATISPQEGIMMNQGTVRYIDLEGGFWGIITDDGRKILPKNLASEHRKDGLRLSFKAQEITGMMTIQQWGSLSKLSDIKVIGQVESNASDPRI